MTGDLETRYAAFGTQVYQVYLDEDPRLTLNCFTLRSSLFVFLVWKKGLTVDVSDSVVACDIKVDIC